MMQIRLARAADCKALWDHSNIHFVESGRDGDFIFNPFEEPWDTPFEKYEAHVVKEWDCPLSETGWSRTWILTDGEKIFGDLTLKPLVRLKTSSHRALLMMGMQRAIRRQGYGSKLMATAVAWASENKIEWLQLNVFANNSPAQALYQNFGFVECGRVKDMFRIHGTSVDDITMVLELK